MNEQAVRAFIRKNARPVDLAWYNWCFEGGSKDAVVKALTAFQNSDGGFGHALEADNWNPASTPISTNDAIIRLNQVGALTKDAPIVKDILRYLKSGDLFIKDKKRWLFAYEGNGAHPHAIWWVPEEGKDGIADFNPTVSLATFIVCYGEDDGFFADIVKEAWAFLMKADKMGGDNISCFLLSYDLLKQNGRTEFIDFDEAKAALHRLMLGEISKDVSKYGVEYATTPSYFFFGRFWQFYSTEFDELINLEKNNLANIQKEDGGFDIFWKWYTPYTEFEEARTMWRPKVSLERLLFWLGPEN